MKAFLTKYQFWLIGIAFVWFVFQNGAILELPEISSRFFSAEISVFKLVVLLAFATFISEDLTCLAAGTLVSQGRINFALAVFACGIGIFVGDILLYGAGRFFGRRMLETKLLSRSLSKEKLRKASEWLDKYGKSSVLLSRFTFGFRLPVYFAAGALKTDFLKFTFYFALAVLFWTPLIVGLSSLLSEEIIKATIFEKNFQIALIFFIIAFYVLQRTLLKLLNWKERRLLIGRIKRIWRWEFWSVRVFYFPVAFYIIWLAIRHRSLTIFTCTNPGIPAGGLVGESKNEIYRSLKKSRAARNYLLQFILVKKEYSASKKIAVARHFIDKHQLQFPLVLKPDAGERGKGVKIVKSFVSLKAELEKIETDYILQEFAEGHETGVFYYRYPNEARGKIFSITEKRFPEVIGDGESTLEELILKDNRAVCLAEKYFEHNREELCKKPAKNEIVQIIDIGTHSQGAVFLDGNHLKTGELEKKIDEICRGFEGFYFGRFDIRASSPEDFRRGANFKIIELNGVSSESTDIYDPQNSLVRAYKVLFRQWRIAFAIGKDNCREGNKPLSLLELATLVYKNLYPKQAGKTVQLRKLPGQSNA